ncbi:MAG TPA: RidA family protein [Candidatus Sulfotelmatobacter sp.]|nr:RidA family protein [Candidatus Sulfotelmatobacter sp.]
MARTVTKVKGLSPPIGPYCHAVRVGDTIFLSGAVSTDARGRLVGRGDIRRQTRAVLQTFRKILKGCGAGMGDVVKTLVFLTDWRHYRAYNEEYGKFFRAAPPARSTVGTTLAQEGLLLEIEAVAVRGASRSKEIITAPTSLWRGRARRSPASPRRRLPRA